MVDTDLYQQILIHSLPPVIVIEAQIFENKYVRSLIFIASFLSYFFLFCILDNKFRKLGVKGSDLDSFSVLIFPEKQVNCGNF